MATPIESSICARPACTRGLLLAAAFALSACSVADNLSYDEIVAELDGIVTISGEGADRAIVYAENAPTSAWYMRMFWLLPIRAPLGWLFGVRHSGPIENPSGHVRDLLTELPDELDSDEVRCAQAVLRFGWIAELDANGNSRVVAFDGLVAAAERMGTAVFPPGFAEVLPATEGPDLAALRATVQAGRPEGRGGRMLSADEREAYRAALAGLVARPLSDWSHRLLLVQDLVEIVRAEGEGDLALVCRDALRTAVASCVRGVLTRSIVSRDPRLVEVRLCAMEHVRRLGGPEVVPWLLLVMSATPEQMARGEPRYDPSPLVQLRLVRYCGQLQGVLAERELVLPGRDNWQSLTPVDFLAQTILNDEGFYARLRVPAMAALTLSLGRPTFDPDPAWVREWFRERRRRA
ncbi:MAG: hypothetical protein JNK78_04025 [Planctomycetes bacterium]|nr:hypothetical protein [Planctomycetota bacterium]